MPPSTRYSIFAALLLSVFAILFAAYSLITIQPPRGLSDLTAEFETLYSQRRVSEDPSDLRSSCDDLWNVFSSLKATHEKGTELIEATFRGWIIFSFVNALVLIFALKTKKT